MHMVATARNILTSMHFNFSYVRSYVYIHRNRLVELRLDTANRTIIRYYADYLYGIKHNNYIKYDCNCIQCI